MSNTTDSRSKNKAVKSVAGKKPVKTDQRYRVQSLGRGLDLLDLIAKGGSLGVRLSELARALSISKAATHAMLQTLLSREFVADVDAVSGRFYRLGLALAHLGDQAISNIALVDIAIPVLRNLTEKVGSTSRVAILDDGFAVVVGRVDAPGAVKFDAALGRREFPHSTAVGKALLAALPRDNARAIVEKIGLTSRTPHTITDLDRLMEELDLIAKRGYAIDDEEDSEGVACLGTCVFDRNGNAAGAISFSSIKHVNFDNHKAENVAALVKYADLISGKLGGQPSNVEWARLRTKGSSE